MKPRRHLNNRRVVIVVQNLPVPFDRRVWLEATSLTKAGYSVTCICPKAKGFDRSFERLEGVAIHRYSIPFEADGALGFVFEFVWCFLRTAMKLFRISVSSGFDVLHICNPPETYFPLGWVVRGFGKRFLFDHHDLSPEMFDAKFDDKIPDRPRSWLRRGLLWCEGRTFAAANMVITTNNSHRQVAIDRGKQDPSDVIVVRSGPDLSRLTITEPERHWRNGKAHLIVYLGEICVQDGVDHLVRAMKHIRDDRGRSDIQCVFVGGGPHQPVVRDYAGQLGLDDCCEFTGRVSDEMLCEVLSSADLGVDPDPLNPWSDQSTMNKIMEYMFFELPVVSYDLAEARVSAAEAGLFVQPNDESALADGILELVDNPDRRHAMGKFGRARIENHLSWEHSEPHLLEAYERVSR